MVYNKKAKKTRKGNVVDSEHVMIRPKTTKKRQSIMNIDDGASPSSQAVCHNDELPEVEDDCYVLLIFF